MLLLNAVWVRENDTHCWLFAFQDEPIGFDGSLDGEVMGDDLVQFHLSSRHLGQEFGHVGLGRPANVGRRILDVSLLKVRVVHPRPPGPGDDKFQFFLVEGLAGDVEPHQPGRHHTTPLAADFGRQLNGLVALGGSHDDRGIHSQPAGQLTADSR